MEKLLIDVPLSLGPLGTVIHFPKASGVFGDA
jgi:hypothetical protein